MKQIDKITNTLMLIILILLPTFRESASYIYISTLEVQNLVCYLCTIARTGSRLESLVTPVSVISLLLRFSVVSLQL